MVTTEISPGRVDSGYHNTTGFFGPGWLRYIEGGITAGKPGASDELLEAIEGITWTDPDSLSYTGDAVHVRAQVEAIGLLSSINSDQALCLIQKILEAGLERNIFEAAVEAAAGVLSKIQDPRRAEMLPLIRRHLERIRSKEDNSQLGIEQDISFDIRTYGEVRHSLDEAYSGALWGISGPLESSFGFVLPLTREDESFFVLRADPATRSIICFDLEGPLSGMDCAYETLSLVPEGRRMFEKISHYDDMICGLVEGKREWRRENYEAGDTLKLIIPHLVHHGISESDIRGVSSKATLVPGVKELFGQLRNNGWTIKIISTSYAQHAHNIGNQLGVAPEDIYCTRLPLDRIRQVYSREDVALIQEFERQLNRFSPEDFGTAKDEELKALMDQFYWQELPQTRLGQAMQSSVVVMGGARKAWAVERVARRLDAYIEQMAFVGDSITDSQAAKVVEAMRGLMIAFNGNDFVIPFATAGLATLDMRSLKPMLDVWRGNGRVGLQEWLKSQPKPEREFDPHRHWLTSADNESLREIVAIHRRFRRKLREDAASLG